MEPDAGWTERLADGSPEAFTEVYRTYRSRLHQYALSLVRSRMEAEDAVHDVFIGLANSASLGRAPRDVAAWLYVATRNRCFDALRRAARQKIDDVDLDLIVAPPGDTERIEHRQILNRALLELPAEQAEVVVLRTWHDLEFAAIAKLQGTSINTALSRYQYGLAKLRKELQRGA